MQRDLPVSFELKRWFASGQASSWWMADFCRGLSAATVYIFDGDDLDRLTVTESDLVELRLPERRCIFECRNSPSPLAVPEHGESFVGHSIVYCWEDPDADFNGLMFQRKSRRAWSRARMHVRLDRGCMKWQYTGSPEVPTGYSWTDDELTTVGQGTSGILARGCIALALPVERTTLKMPTAKRQKLAREGVSGFEYKIIELPAEVVARQVAQGGTHASPRWHRRRGHYRTLRSGNRVWVRSCQVGDPTRGVVIKDYAVSL